MVQAESQEETSAGQQEEGSEVEVNHSLYFFKSEEQADDVGNGTAIDMEDDTCSHMTVWSLDVAPILSGASDCQNGLRARAVQYGSSRCSSQRLSSSSKGRGLESRVRSWSARPSGPLNCMSTFWGSIV